MTIDLFNPWHQVLLLFLSIVVGFVIGIEREYRNKFAGLRTFMLTAFGSCLFTILSTTINTESTDRIAANIVTGIGFLGAGVIFKEDNKITGITTATSIWATASIGMAMGYGNILLAFIGTLIVMLVLYVLVIIQNKIDTKYKIKLYKIGVEKYDTIHMITNEIKNAQMKSESLHIEKSNDQIIISLSVSGTIDNHETLQKSIINNPLVISCYS